MQVRATAKIKITATPEIVQTISTYSRGLQYCIDSAWQHSIKNNVKLHPLVYKDLRKTLPAQLAVACIKQACGIVKKAKSKPIISRASVRYNFPRSASFNGSILNLRTLAGRQKVAVTFPAHFQQYLNWKITESLLRMDRKGRCYFLFVFSKEVDAEATNLQSRVLGIDLGINNLAVTSDGRFFNSSKIKQAKRKFRYLRSVLQAKGTRAAKRLLRAIKGRETRYMAWVNHNISKQIVSGLVAGDCINMENLKGIRKQRRGRRMNYWINNWSFYQLQSFVRYKAERFGIVVKQVQPSFTSQICHKCGCIGTRTNRSFSCSCGVSHFNADLNAARNLAHPMLGVRQAAVKQPNVADDDGKASHDGLRLNPAISLQQRNAPQLAAVGIAVV